MTPDIAVILTDASRKIQWVNDGFTKITGYSLVEVLGQKPSILQGPDSDPEVIQRIREGLNNQEPFKEEITNYRKDGERYLCKLVVYPIFDNEGELTNFIAFEIDGDQSDDSDLPMLQLQKKYHSSSLKGNHAIHLYYELCNLIESEKCFLDPDLSLRYLAQRLQTNTKYLSQVINHFAGQNFQSFLNTYRIEAVIKALRKPANRDLTHFGVAMKCGFKNKSTFYKVFQKHTGYTPGKFLQKLKKQL